MIAKHPQGIAIALWVALSLMIAPHAHGQATCTAAPPVVLSVPPIEAPAKPVVGQVLGNPDGYEFASRDALRCTYSPYVIQYWSTASVPIQNLAFSGRYFAHSGLSMPVYSTGLTGVGFALMAQDQEGGTTLPVTTGLSTLRAHQSPGIPTWGLRGRLFFVATGPITGGALPARTFAMFRVYTASTPHLLQYSGVQINVPRKPTCSVATPTVPLDLGAVNSRDFKGIGSVAGTASRNIVLQCADSTGPTLDVWVTVTDQSQPANRSDRLSLTPASTAKGIALQLLHGNRLINYGPDAVGTANQWLAGTTGNGSFLIPLTARYVQTDHAIRPGTAKGLATFTLDYR